MQSRIGAGSIMDTQKNNWDARQSEVATEETSNSHLARRGFLVCPNCLRAYPAEIPHSSYSCRFCHHEWMPPINLLGDIYFTSFDEIDTFLSDTSGEIFPLKTFPAIIGRNSDFRVLQRNVAVSRQHCKIDFNYDKGIFEVTPFQTGGGTYLNRQILPPGIAHAIFPDDLLVISGVVLTLQCKLNRELTDRRRKMLRPACGISLSHCRTFTYIDADAASDIRLKDERTSHSIAVILHKQDSNEWTLFAIDHKRIQIDGYAFIEQKLAGGENIQIENQFYVFNAINGSFDAGIPENGEAIELIQLSAGYQNKTVLRD